MEFIFLQNKRNWVPTNKQNNKPIIRKFWINYQSSQIIQELFWNLLLTHRQFWIFRTLHSFFFEFWNKHFSCTLIKFFNFPSHYALNFTFYFQVVNSGCTFWSRESLLSWKDNSCQLCSFICSFIFEIISSHVRILVLIGSIFSKSDQTDLIEQKY